MNWVDKSCFITQQFLYRPCHVVMAIFVWGMTPTLTLMGTTSMEEELKCVIMKHIVQCVMKDGVTVMLLLSALTLVIAHLIIVSHSLIRLKTVADKIHIITVAEGTYGSVFGLSDETPVLQNVMCNGSEYYLSECEGYNLNNVSGDYCLSGNYQAGVRCIEGITNQSVI